MEEAGTKIASSAVVESEHVVEAEEACGAAGEEVEYLSELNGIFTTINEQVAWNEAKDAIVDWGLGIEALDDMLDLSERAELINDGSNTLELLALKTEHGFVSVQFFELLRTVIHY